MIRRTIDELTPFFPDTVEAVYAAAEASEGSLVPQVPLIGTLVQRMIRGSSSIQGLNDYDVFTGETNANQADVILQNRLRRAETDEEAKGAILSFGSSLVMGLAIDKAYTQHDKLKCRIVDETEIIPFILEVVGPEQNFDKIYPYLDKRLGLDTRRIATGYGHRIGQLLEGEPESQDGIAAFVGYSMLAGYLITGGE